jgi:hypothetical protein
MSDTYDFDDLYGSKYFSVADLKDGEPRFKIGKVEVAQGQNLLLPRSQNWWPVHLNKQTLVVRLGTSGWCHYRT